MSFDTLTPQGQKFVTDLVDSQHNAAWNAAIDAAVAEIEKYGLSRVNGMKDYPAATASACAYHVRELRR